MSLSEQKHTPKHGADTLADSSPVVPHPSQHSKRLKLDPRQTLAEKYRLGFLDFNDELEDGFFDAGYVLQRLACVRACVCVCVCVCVFACHCECAYVRSTC